MWKRRSMDTENGLQSLSTERGIGDNDIYWTWLQCDQYSVFDTFRYHFITIQASQKATSNPTPLKLVFVIDLERGHGDIMGHAGHLRQGHEYRGV